MMKLPGSSAHGHALKLLVLIRAYFGCAGSDFAHLFS
jgi:hypothetical protein